MNPAYLNLKTAADYSGLSSRYLSNLVRENRVKSFLVRMEANQPRGRRLIERASLDAFITGDHINPNTN